jgi:molybdopterin synthase catalytic subunit
MDYLKTRAPFWKLVERPGGRTWIAAKTIDEDAAERWHAAREDETAE